MVSQFELFRYQLLPRDRYLQKDFWNGINSIDELIDKKNDIFDEILLETKHFVSARTETATKTLFSKDGFYLYRIAANRSLHRETKEFTDEYMDNWPSVLVAIWNKPDIQMIAVQKRTTAFNSGDVVVKLILDGTYPFLSKYNLRAIHEPIVEKQVFWDIIEKYSGRIQRLEFEFVTPNMANISKTLPENLKEFAKATNSVKNRLDIEADSETSLHIDQSNKIVSSLVDYTSDGGGNIGVKISRMAKKINTSKTVKHVEMSDVELQGTAEEIVDVLKELMR